MDMRSFNLDKYKDLLLVPYRPCSGKNAKDFRTTFIFTMDALQVDNLDTETRWSSQKYQDFHFI